LSNSSVSRLSSTKLSLSSVEVVDSFDLLISCTITGSSLEPCVLRKVLFTMPNSSVSRTPSPLKKALSQARLLRRLTPPLGFLFFGDSVGSGTCSAAPLGSGTCPAAAA